jgi:hypothetical protein
VASAQATITPRTTGWRIGQVNSLPGEDEIKAISVAPTGSATAAEALSPANVWAVGGTRTAKRWTGSAWKSVSLPAPRPGDRRGLQQAFHLNQQQVANHSRQSNVKFIGGPRRGCRTRGAAEFRRIRATEDIGCVSR